MRDDASPSRAELSSAILGPFETMLHTVMIVGIVFLLTVVMTMSGRGGGSFYVIALVLAGVPVHTASTTSQLILFSGALAGAFVFGKAGSMSWPLVFFFGGLNASMAFVGGFEAHRFSGATLKVVLSLVLLVAGGAMLAPVTEATRANDPRVGRWNIVEGEARYVINLWMAAPLTLATGFLSGMVGIAGGAFLIPLMVVGCGVPVQTAVGTATTMIASSALTGFAGHALNGGFDAALGVPCGVVAIAGGLIGGRLALRTKPKKLKSISGIITIVAALIMMASALAGE